MGQSAKQSRDDFKDVQELEDLSLQNFPEEILRQVVSSFNPKIHLFSVNKTI